MKGNALWPQRIHNVRCENGAKKDDRTHKWVSRIYSDIFIHVEDGEGRKLRQELVTIDQDLNIGVNSKPTKYWSEVICFPAYHISFSKGLPDFPLYPLKPDCSKLVSQGFPHE